jgi:pilus assembly protein CpaC
MTFTSLVRRIMLTAAWILIVAVLQSTTLNAQVQAVAAAAVSAVSPPAVETAIEAAPSAVQLIAGRSTVLNLTSPIARVSLTSADIADALVTTPTQLLIHGKTPGTISMLVWERAGIVHRYEVVVGRDVAKLAEQVRQLFPKESIAVSSNGRDVVLSGTASSKEMVDRAVSLSAGFVDKKEEVVNLLQVQARRSTQVLLQVRFAEVSRAALTELGISLFTSPTGINNTLGRVTTQQFSAPGFSDLKTTKTGPDWEKFGAPVTSAEGKFTFGDFLNLFILSEKYDLGVLIKALQSRGLFQSLAEPNLVAESGKEASFLAGGEFPIPVAQAGGGNAITIEFKEFGVRLNFTPVVDGDRVHLKVRPEVSTLDFANGIQLQGFRIPALISRRTETELELIDGQTFAIAGLLNNTMNQTLQKVPGIGDIPILGYLFRSKAAQKNRTELVVMITPHILPEGSKGVTPDLPRLGEPYLPPLPQDQSLAPQPPPFPAPNAPLSQAAVAPAQLAAPVAVVAANSAVRQPTAAERKAQERAAARQREEAAQQARTEARKQKEQAKLAADIAKRTAREEAQRAAREKKK